jgi:hypothetical protein
MATDLENSLRQVASKIAQYVDDVATMTVLTQYVVVASNGDVVFDQAKPLARTVLKLDGDSESIVPMRTTAEGRPELDRDLLSLHQANVTTAIDYRARILSALIDALRPREPAAG